MATKKELETEIKRLESKCYDLTIEVNNLEDDISSLEDENCRISGDVNMLEELKEYITELSKDVNYLCLRPTPRDLKTVVYELERIIHG